MKLTKKQINLIAQHTPADLVGTHQGIVTDLGYYQPAGANWSYHAGWTYDGQLVVTQFGHVVGRV